MHLVISIRRCGRILALIAAFVAVASGAFAAETRRPNFIFLYADDQRWDALGVVQREQGKQARFPWFQTPHLDRLAAGGVRFRNAFVVHSLCTPSRASFLTGRYTHSHGVAGNYTSFPPDAANHGSLLRKAGYATAYIGKWHMGDGGGQRPGFEHSASYRGHGRCHDPVFEVDGREVATKGWVDDVATDFAIDFIRKNRSRPFSMAVGFKSPHAEFVPPARLRTTFAGEELGPPPNWNNPAIYLGRVQLVQSATIKPGGNRRVDDPLDYFRVIAGIDENVGRLLATLDELGLADDTMVIYSSDNGYHLGDHGIGDKRSAYEESMRVPLLVRYPRLREMRGVTDDAMVLNIDLAPTLLDFAGAPPDPSMQGRSWRPILERRANTIRDQFLYEYFFYPDISDYELQTANCPITP
ncbi:MAG: sulfatase-like hydrolase/transferase, partial [Opitutaceae bacterium]